MTQQLLKIIHQPFDYQYLKDLFGDYRYPRNKISKLLKAGEIIALKSGLYVLSNQFGRIVVPEQVANLLYGPSYVSLDYALAYYGLIPEKVFSISSVCIGRKKLYETAVGRFTYQQLKPEYYSMAYSLQNSNRDGYLMASPEKAMCDKLYFAKAISTLKDMEQYLFEDLRIDRDALNNFDAELVAELAGVSAKRNIKLFKELII